jgi:ABC-type branched-subunit amino acid transport system substrate-binding protein
VKAEKELRIGGLGPLTLPGLPWAGRELRDGMSLAVQQLNGLDGVMGRRLTLLFEDTHGRREPGVAAVERLFEKSAHALAAEFHSVVANAIVEQVERRGLPFVCASASWMTSQPADWVSCSVLHHLNRTVGLSTPTVWPHRGFAMSSPFKKIVLIGITAQGQ